MTVRWGVAGPGAIATSFAQGMTMVDGGEITAVASRSLERADGYADRFGVVARYDSYEALAEDTEVDAVYVATPHARHEADTLLFVEAGKHVLCEKPFALNARQARRMVDAARAQGVFCMEAMWSRFLPAYRALVDLLGEGRIGEPLQVEADFGYRTPVVPEDRHFDLHQGGGALLDLGIYPVQLCTLVLGLPDGVSAEGVIGTTGVDEQVAAVLHHRGDTLGVVKAALRVPLACTARIAGTDGWIEVPAFMHCPEWLEVSGRTGPERIDADYDGEGLRFEVDAVHRCLAEGLTESPVMALDETVAIAGVLDDIRAQIGVVYPGE
ncbi:MAG TPA: Gfo/Idh/MocA family oxidoreductase [Acidimicrobiales bacterium]